jgi:hypothetical protein
MDRITALLLVTTDEHLKKEKDNWYHISAHSGNWLFVYYKEKVLFLGYEAMIAIK